VVAGALVVMTAGAPVVVLEVVAVTSAAAVVFVAATGAVVVVAAAVVALVVAVTSAAAVVVFVAATGAVVVVAAAVVALVEAVVIAATASVALVEKPSYTHELDEGLDSNRMRSNVIVPAPLAGAVQVNDIGRLNGLTLPVCVIAVPEQPSDCMPFGTVSVPADALATMPSKVVFDAPVARTHNCTRWRVSFVTSAGIIPTIVMV
jgi:hypothetical protein